MQQQMKKSKQFLSVVLLLAAFFCALGEVQSDGIMPLLSAAYQSNAIFEPGVSIKNDAARAIEISSPEYRTVSLRQVLSRREFSRLLSTGIPAAYQIPQSTIADYCLAIFPQEITRSLEFIIFYIHGIDGQK